MLRIATLSYAIRTFGDHEGQDHQENDQAPYQVPDTP
jgi:hypothetical protein